MKRLFAILIAAMMLLSLAACGDNNTTDPDKDNPGVSQSGENNDGGGASNKASAGNLIADDDNQHYDAAEELSGIPNIGCPEGFSVYKHPSGGDDLKQVVYKADSGTVTEDDVANFAAAIWNLCIDVAEDGAMFKYSSVKKEKTGYSDLSDAKQDDGRYIWYYEINGNIIKIRIGAEAAVDVDDGELELHVEKMVTD